MLYLNPGVDFPRYIASSNIRSCGVCLGSGRIFRASFWEEKSTLAEYDAGPGSFSFLLLKIYSVLDIFSAFRNFWKLSYLFFASRAQSRHFRYILGAGMAFLFCACSVSILTFGPLLRPLAKWFQCG